MKDKWKRSSDYVRFARNIGCKIERVYRGVVKVIPLCPAQSEMLQTFRNQQDLSKDG